MLKTIFLNNFEKDDGINIIYPILRKPHETKLIRTKREYFQENQQYVAKLHLKYVFIDDFDILSVYSDIIFEMLKILKMPKKHFSLLYNPGSHTKDLLYFTAILSNVNKLRLEIN